MEKIELFENFDIGVDPNTCFDILSKNIKWHETLLSVNNEPVKIKRKMAYVYDRVVTYYYSTLHFEGELWIPVLETIRDKVNGFTGIEFNSVLLNYYKNGKDEIKWHSDKEENLGDISESVIATVNLGATRKFWYLNKATGDKDFYSVANGGLLMMNAGFQNEYLHAILPEKQIKDPRISLTFRKVTHD